jgi:hypothetical protein
MSFRTCRQCTLENRRDSSSWLADALLHFVELLRCDAHALKMPTWIGSRKEKRRVLDAASANS